jgi:hypothetical protein
MEHACVNPYCSCDDCDCEPPCSCGLVLIGHTTDELWDAGTGELTYTVTSRYRHAPRRRRRQSEYDDGDAAGHDHREPLPRVVQIGDPADLLADSLRDDVREAAVLASYREASAAAGHAHGHPSVRTAEHKGHTIEIRTTYDVRIDGEPMEAHLGVSNDGSVHYHGLPNYSEASAIDLMRRVIDAFPDDYPPADDHDHEEG